MESSDETDVDLLAVKESSHPAGGGEERCEEPVGTRGNKKLRVELKP